MQEKLRRLKGGRSYAEIGEALHCAPERVRKWIDAGAEPHFRIGVQLAAYFGVSPQWLGDDAADWPPPASTDERILETVRSALAGAGAAGSVTDAEREALAALRRLPETLAARAVGVLVGMAAAAGEPISPAATSDAGMAPQERADWERLGRPEAGRASAPAPGRRKDTRSA